MDSKIPRWLCLSVYVDVFAIYSCRFMVCLCKVGSTWGTTMWTLVYCVLWDSNILQSVNSLNTCSTIVGFQLHLHFHTTYTSLMAASYSGAHSEV